jgi:predicted ATPase
MISKIEAVNFRCLLNTSQTLDNFQVITGPNGSGKSTFLEVPYLLGEFAREGLDALIAATRARKFEELTFRGAGGSIQLALETAVPESQFNGHSRGETAARIRYEVEIGRYDHDTDDDPPHILSENLWLISSVGETPKTEPAQRELFPLETFEPRSLITSKSPKGWRKIASKTVNQNSYFRSETTEWNLQIRNPVNKSALSTLPEDERFPLSNWFKSEMAVRLQKIMLRSELMQAPSDPFKGKRFATDGSNLPQVIDELRKDGPSFKGWLDHLRTILPIQDVQVHRREEDGKRFLEVIYSDGIRVKSWHLSDGTLRMMALTLLAYIPDVDAIYLVEEPENGVHPQAVEAVFQSLSSLYDGQALVATHSPVFVAQVKPEQLLCFSKNTNGATDIVRGDLHPKLQNWRGGLDLPRLYAAGLLS